MTFVKEISPITHYDEFIKYFSNTFHICLTKYRTVSYDVNMENKLLKRNSVRLPSGRLELQQEGGRKFQRKEVIR